MNAEVNLNVLPQVKTAEQFEATIKETEYGSDKKLYTVVKIPNHILKDIEQYLEERAENAEAKDFDEDGYLESYTDQGEDGIENLLSHLFTVRAEKNEYEVTITVRVEAFTEEEAEEEVYRNLSDYTWDVEVTEV